MKTILITTLQFLFCSLLGAQNTFTGSYSGLLNGEKVSLTLESAGSNNLKGEMKDSENTYVVTATQNNNTLTGKAVEKVWGITFEMEGVLKGEELNTRLTMDILGFKESMDVVFRKQGSSAVASSSEKNTKSGDKNPVSGKNRDSRVAGTWVKESNYSSGYGSNNTYGSMSSRETMIFYADGGMADGGSSTVISGGNYSGRSSGEGGNRIPGLFWYTEGNKLFLSITQDGQTQQAELGKYYIEDGKMLITASNGEKLLLYRQ